MNTFEYLQPNSLEEASAMLRENTSAMIFAGGTDALGLMKTDIQAPDKVVNLKTIPELNKIEFIPGKGLKVGALVTISELAADSLVKEKWTALAEAAFQVASPQLRNVGTIGGNICQRPRCWYFREDFECFKKGGNYCYAMDGENKYHAVIGGAPCFIVYPSDPAVALMALDAEVTIVNENSEKTIPIKDFYALPDVDVLKENILETGDIVKEIFIPVLPEGTVSGYYKFKEREVWNFAVVSSAVVLKKDGNTIASGKAAFGGVAPAPWIDKKFDDALRGLSTDEATLKKAADNIIADADTLEKNKYKIPLVRNITVSLIQQLMS